ncbi:MULTISPECIES: bifunctional glycosyltransferase family 2 protein/CDP-glycerol:glycerophosphate glycerophosphotransferase [unclassified Streptomyces]|uniref:bifunctional glycosyltransferase/CDP-glycerol:glycerophosphate glycerophosphotransferase n=1 Tax=unclassified Streptomyces TaxID=2593676 RepID=UPI002ED0C202|nr:bifunctional glycosyltransferase family 2 protein/CDP-glycerol:glycerophosphate glycerophosphotransferase [Streptomyces sp. NBC_00891]WSY05743.1 bifunctional glycosyltransferase family 2 protein/CDP-glycerol:glycerophosphate glycerophosphotransferase [Streptomyces sp. NBC_00890]WSZ07367.1 bifunctional glycosyltransferase family 2 protein/CDP-glycerol:glycerophosphate glycerophosphotransferase [Streptomyces sp. NBC_00869]WSZ25134.1 bifunctional glycosyltransferase family 2 protein/CDP-glycerol
MPRLSVIIPVRRARGSLRECLESVLSQSFTDIEVIGVDDHAPDGSGLILDEFAARDSRVRAVHLDPGAGAHGRRNAGIEKASGDYVLFLEGHYIHLPGALQAVADRLESTGDPDVLLFGHRKRPFRGKTRSTRSLEKLASLPAGPLTLAERPDLLDIAPVSWNRAVRRAVLERENVSFGPGPHGERMYALATVAVAASVATLDTACVEHRQQRYLPGLVDDGEPSGGSTPLELVGAYDTLMTFVEARPALKDVRGVLFDRAVQELLSAYPTVTGRRRQYVGAVASFHAAHRPAGFRFPGGAKGLRPQLIGGGKYTALGALDTALATRRTLRSAPAAARAKAKKQFTKRYYAAQRKLPLDPGLAVYAAYWNRGVSCNPEAVYRKAEELAPHIHGVWVVSKNHVDSVPEGIDYVVPGTRRYWSVLARATYFFNNVNFPDHLVKRPGQIHVMTHHGTPLKIMGMDQQNYPAAAQGLNFDKLLKRVDRWDWSVSANPHSTEVWSRAYPGTARPLETGYPRNDVFATATAEQIAKIREDLGIRPGQRAVLYAPTHRDYEAGFTNRLDLDRFCAAVGPDTVVLMRAHYFYDGSGEPENASVIDVSAHPRVEDLCLAADALVTDYSSVMFDYAHLNRPIVILAPDWDTYRTVRGVVFDLLSGQPGETPGAVAMDTDELAEIFTGGGWNSPENEALLKAFKERFCPYDDGRASERVVRRVLLGEEL